MQEVAGRIREQERLKKLLKTYQSELLVVYGRRRIGKTYLIRSVYKQHICFSFSGLHNAYMHDQLENFSIELNKHYASPLLIKPLKSWLVAFKLLENYLDSLKTPGKKVVFFDEFPWLATSRSKFLTAFEHFWNTYATYRTDLIVVICGSSASYMIKKVLLNKGGLHNRITEKMRLMPFNLNETELFLRQKGTQFTKPDIIQLYMSLGGVPHYLNLVEKGESVPQAIDRLCFTKDGFLITEFETVFVSLFENDHLHKEIVTLLAQARQGLTRSAIIQRSTHFKSGGTLTAVLNELIESGFVTQYPPYKGTVKQSLFRLTDEYSLFYLKFIQGKKRGGEGTWLTFHTKQTYVSWCGFSFESLCIKHVIQIKKALGIEKVHTEQASWVKRGAADENGCQIDLLIDRADRIINICEVKFYKDPFVISKKYAAELQYKIAVFRADTKTRKNIFPVLITLNGLIENDHSLALIQNHLEATLLFKPD